jgi:hypothetical protein
MQSKVSLKKRWASLVKQGAAATGRAYWGDLRNIENKYNAAASSEFIAVLAKCACCAKPLRTVALTLAQMAHWRRVGGGGMGIDVGAMTVVALLA